MLKYRQKLNGLFFTRPVKSQHRWVGCGRQTRKKPTSESEDWRDCRWWVVRRQWWCKHQQHVPRVIDSRPPRRSPTARTQPSSRRTGATRASCPPAPRCDDSAPPPLVPDSTRSDALQRQRHWRQRDSHTSTTGRPVYHSMTAADEKQPLIVRYRRHIRKVQPS